MGLGIVKLGQGQWAVKDGNLLAAKDTNGRLKNAEFTVTRGTRATYVGRDGLIKESNLQDVNLVNNGDFSELGSELVTNGTFDTDSDWTKQTGWSIANGVAIANNVPNGQRLQQGLGSSVVGKTYKYSFNISNVSGAYTVYVFGVYPLLSVNTEGLVEGYVTATSTNGAFFISGATASGLTSATIDNVSVQQVDPNDRWIEGTNWIIEDGKGVANNSSSYIKQNNLISNNKTFKIQFDTTITSGQFRLVATADAATYTSYVTESGSYTFYMKPTVSINGGLEFVGSSFTGTIDNIVVNEVKTDTPRIDFTDNTDGHLLLEPQSTNLLPYSEDIASWNFITVGVVATSNYGISPDGTQNSTRIVFSDASQQYSHTLTTVSGVTGSIYIKGTSGETIAFGVKNVETLYTLDGSWQRFSEYGTATSNKITVNTYGGATARDIEIWGGQMEALSHPTSYIPTNGSTVTRDAETCNNSGDAIDFNSEEGVLYAEIAAFADDLSNRFISLTDGTDSNSVTIYYGGVSNRIRYEVKSSSAVQANVVTTSYDITNYNKIAVKYKANDFALWVNGTNVAQDASGLTPVGLNDLSFDRASILDFYGKVKAVRVYKEALSDTDLQNLTS